MTQEDSMKKMMAAFWMLGIFSGAALQANGNYSDNRCCAEECCDGTFSVGGDWLYWKTEETQLEYGAAVTGVTGDADPVISAKVLQPNFKYDSGFRLFADYVTCDKLWKLSAIYTHVPANAKNNFSDTSMMGLSFASIFNMNFPIFSAIANAPLDSLNSKWNSDVNYFDFDVSRAYTLCDSLQVTPHIGLRGLWSTQTLRLNGTSGDDLAFQSKLHQSLGSIGLEGGVKAAWQLYEGLSLVGDIGGSVLYSRSRNNGSLTATTTDGSLSILFKNNSNKGIPMFDAFVGLQYETCLCDYTLKAVVGWEQHIIYGLNNFSLSSSGNMTLQGLTLGLGISL